MLSYLAPALNAAATRSLTPAKAWLAAAVRERACQKKKKKRKLPAAEISCISQTISPAHYALRCLLGDG